MEQNHFLRQIDPAVRSSVTSNDYACSLWQQGTVRLRQMSDDNKTYIIAKSACSRKRFSFYAAASPLAARWQVTKRQVANYLINYHLYQSLYPRNNHARYCINIQSRFQQSRLLQAYCAYNQLFAEKPLRYINQSAGYVAAKTDFLNCLS